MFQRNGICVSSLTIAVIVSSGSLVAQPAVRPVKDSSTLEDVGVVVRVPGVETRVIARGLVRPTGIVAANDGTIYFSEVPTPGQGGGANGVLALAPGTFAVSRVNQGEPEPTNLALGPDGTLYWTCKSAGVILQRTPDGTIGPLLRGLEQPSGIAVDRFDEVYFTQLPTPGVAGPKGGRNTVNRFAGAQIETLTLGEPEPTDIAVADDGTAYWSCRSAGVVLKRGADGVVSPLLRGLDKPVGIAIDNERGILYLTEVPTPGVPGTRGGRNRVTALDLTTGRRSLVDFGDPEPIDIAVGPAGELYWTCRSAGVIVEATFSR